jgi:thymidylate synthase
MCSERIREAEQLKRNIDKRSQVVVTFLTKYLDQEELETCTQSMNNKVGARDLHTVHEQQGRS